jgi:hypothetical protein
MKNTHSAYNFHILDTQKRKVTNKMRAAKEILKETMDAARQVMIAKNRDYSGAADENADSLGNFRYSEKLGVKPFIGVLIRMQDKLMRIEAFLKSGSLSVLNESVVDSIVDNMNYCILGYCVSKTAPKTITPSHLIRIHDGLSDRAINHTSARDFSEQEPAGLLKLLRLSLEIAATEEMRPGISEEYDASNFVLDYLVLSANLLSRMEE